MIGIGHRVYPAVRPLARWAPRLATSGSGPRSDIGIPILPGPDRVTVMCVCGSACVGCAHKRPIYVVYLSIYMHRRGPTVFALL